MMRKNKLFLFILLSLLLLLLPFCLIGCQKGETISDGIELNHYVIVEQSGYDGYGTISVSIDYEKMINEHIQDKSLSADVLDLVEAFEPFSPRHPESKVLKNEDVVEIKWDKNKEAVVALQDMLQKDIYDDVHTHVVEGLKKTREYDPFDDLYMETNGTSDGSGAIDFTIRLVVNDGDDILWNVKHNGTDGSLKNGDTLHLTIEDEIDENEFTRRTGYVLSKKETDYTIDCLCLPAVDETIFDKIAMESEENFNTVIEEWVVAGLNDEHANEDEPREYRNIGYVYYTNATESSEKKNGMLFAIYEMEDSFVSTPYYVFIGIEGNFTTDHYRTYINGKEFSDSFVDYEKETVRYSEKFGWGEGQEKMGFLIDGVSYAGHQKVQETLDYLSNTYGSGYEKHFVSARVMDFVEAQAIK